MRFRGALIRFVLPYYSVPLLRTLSTLMRFTFPTSTFWPSLPSKAIQIKRADGSLLRALVFKPQRKNKEKLPAVLWFYGGGYAMGSPLVDKRYIVDFVKRTGSILIAPFYTQSPVKPFPAAHNDGYLALEYIYENASSLGLDRDRIAVAGNSAGGGLATSVVLRARDEGKIKVNCFFPIYPMLSDVEGPFSDAPVWNTKSDISAWKLYLRDDYQTNNISPYAAPLRSDSFKGFPPMCTYIGTVDPFLSSTREFVKRLKEDGVETAYKEYTGAFHAFDLLTTTREAADARSFLLENYKRWQKCNE